MRVLETDPSVIYKMGKTKKHKIRKAKENDADDSSEDGILNGKEKKTTDLSIFISSICDLLSSEYPNQTLLKEVITGILMICMHLFQNDHNSFHLNKCGCLHL